MRKVKHQDPSTAKPKLAHFLKKSELCCYRDRCHWRPIFAALSSIALISSCPSSSNFAYPPARYGQGTVAPFYQPNPPPSLHQFQITTNFHPRAIAGALQNCERKDEEKNKSSRFSFRQREALVILPRPPRLDETQFHSRRLFHA